MTLINIKMLLAAPPISIALATWAYSNRQMFENKIDPIKTVGEVILSHHLLTDSKYPNHPHVLLLKFALLCSVIIIVFISINQDIISNALRSKKIKEMPDYTDALKLDRC
jgi:hypothetical protein